MEEVGVRTVETSEANTHSFIVKIWLEVTAEETRPAVWCGQITHVPSGEQRTFSRLCNMTAFVAPSLVSMGVKPSSWQRLAQPLERLRR